MLPVIDPVNPLCMSDRLYTIARYLRAMAYYNCESSNVLVRRTESMPQPSKLEVFAVILIPSI